MGLILPPHRPRPLPFDLAPHAFLAQPPLARPACRFCRSAFPRHHHRRLDQLQQPRFRVRPIRGLRSTVLRNDPQPPLRIESAFIARPQPLFDVSAQQRARREVETKRHARAYFIDMLPPRPRRAVKPHIDPFRQIRYFQLVFRQFRSPLRQRVRRAPYRNANPRCDKHVLCEA